METTSTMGLPLIGLGGMKVPRIKVPKKNTHTTMLVTVQEDRTPFCGNIALSEEPEYTEEQFSTDLKKASKHLDALLAQALEEHARGETEEFPV